MNDLCPLKQASRVRLPLKKIRKNKIFRLIVRSFYLIA